MAIAVTSPALDTVAIPVLLEPQVIARPVSTLLLASRVVAVACVVCPGFNELAPRATDTLATGAGAGSTTLMLAWALTPSLVALMVVLPGATAEIIPESVTLAIAELELCQVIGRSERGPPLASRAVAVAFCFWPRIRERAGNTRETEATGVF